MNTTNATEIKGVNTTIAYCEAQGFSKVFDAYSTINEEIFEIGFNPYSGYVYIALENGISICSMMGREVEYLVTDFENGDERFYNTYEQALDNYGI
jgi:hypothetical protein